MKYFLSLMGILILSIAIVAQETCPAIVTDMILDLQAVCSDMARNQLCYVNNQIVVQTSEDIDFSLPGDIVDIEFVDSIQTIANAEDNLFGIALLLVQANLPNTLPGQNVTFLLFGETYLSNAHIEVGEGEVPYAPMQAIYFSSGVGRTTCNDVPQDGLLIQTPDSDEAIELFINGAEIVLGSTAFITAQAEGDMTITVVEGEGIVSADNSAVLVPEGSSTTVALDENLNAVSAPSEPESYSDEAVDSLPVGDTEIAEPADEEDIVTANAHVGAFGSCWMSTDIDGSSQTLCIRAVGRNLFSIYAIDDGGTVCGDTGTATDVDVIITGSGSVNASGVLESSVTYQCLGGNNANGNADFIFTPNADGTLTDNFGVVWSR